MRGNVYLIRPFDFRLVAGSWNLKVYGLRLY